MNALIVMGVLASAAIMGELRHRQQEVLIHKDDEHTGIV
jgi:hypothetical protein